jgi:hypothetical protein
MVINNDRENKELVLASELEDAEDVALMRDRDTEESIPWEEIKAELARLDRP